MTHFEVSFPVRYYETDQMAVVHHSNYIRYFEIARNSMMVAWGFPIERCENEYGVMIPIVSVECRFKHPARMGDVLTAVAEIDKTPLCPDRGRRDRQDAPGETRRPAGRPQPGRGSLRRRFRDPRLHRRQDVPSCQVPGAPGPDYRKPSKRQVICCSFTP